jgi:STE24 endopeptidase
VIENIISDSDAPSFNFFLYFLIALVSIRIITVLIDYRQLQEYLKVTIDPYLVDFFEQKEFQDSQKYNAEKTRFSILHKIIDTAIEVALWVFFIYVGIWNWMDGIMSSLSLCSDTIWINDFIQAYLFLILLTLIQMLINVPFSLYKTFVIEEKYGFNKMGMGTFISDQVKTFLLTALLSVIVLPLLLWIIAVSGAALVPVLAIVSVVMVFVISLLVPVFIIPCFFKYSELEEGELRTAIFREAERTNVPVSQIRVIDGSQRSSHSNAFVAGMLWFRKIVLFDTLINQHPQEEIIAIINHELGHVAYNHIYKQMIMSAIQMIIMFSFFGIVLGNKGVLQSFGFDHASSFLYLFIFSQLYMPIDFLTRFLAMALIRRAEY